MGGAASMEGSYGRERAIEVVGDAWDEDQLLDEAGSVDGRVSVDGVKELIGLANGDYKSVSRAPPGPRTCLARCCLVSGCEYLGSASPPHELPRTVLETCLVCAAHEHSLVSSF